MSDLSLADRLVGVMQVADQAREAARVLTDSAGKSPRFEIEMAITEQLDGLHKAFMVAYCNIDRLRSIANKVRPTNPKSDTP